MSYQIGIDTINLKAGPRPAHTEYMFAEGAIRQVLERFGGEYKEILSRPNLHLEGFKRPFADLWDYDFLWCTNDHIKPWNERGRVTDLGHAVYVEGGDDKRSAKECPFKSVDEVHAFDAVSEYGLEDFDELVRYYEKFHSDAQAANLEQVVPGGYYKTIVSGAIDSFGWDMLLMAAAEQDRFEKVLDSFFRLSMHHYRAWAETSIKVFLSHDDMVWTSGPFMHPDFYRRVIFPRYKELWAVLKQAGKKVLYCSDGTWTEFMDDIADAGADGFLFEPTTSFEYAVKNFSKTHVIASSKVDCRTLTFGTKDEIQREIDSTLELGADCPGLMFVTGNHIAANVPAENALFYFDYLSKNWTRQGVSK